MKLSSAADLKHEILDRARSQHQVVQLYSVRSRAAGPIERRLPRPVVAVGVAPAAERKRDYRVAVRIYKGQEREARQVLRPYAQHRDELDIARDIEYKARGLTLYAGGSSGHYRINAGTLGAFVEDSDQYYMLSNNHVFANSDKASIGDPILQPGPVDITTASGYKEIGSLHSYESLSNGTVDAALATFTDEVSYFYPHKYKGIGDIKTNPIPDRYSVTEVTKRGRTTGVTQGRVSAFSLDGVTINYGSPVGVVTFNDQIEVVGDPETTDFSQPGDSGSLIIDKQSMHPYALLYGGGRDNLGIDRTLAHYITDVLTKLRVRFVT